MKQSSLAKVLAVLTAVAFFGLSACDSGPKRPTDPEVIEKMEPFEYTWIEWANRVETDYLWRHELFANRMDYPSDYEAYDHTASMETMKEELASLENLDYVDQEPYKTALADMRTVYKKIKEVDEAIFGIEIYWRQNQARSSALMQAGGDERRAADALVKAAHTIGIPKSEWPQWVKEKSDL